MAKVCPISPTSTCSSPYTCSSTEAFTIWMKSLICNSNGCTVYDSNGEIVYRIDNYDTKHSKEVHLMNRCGKVLFTIRKKKFNMIWCWEGFKYHGIELDEREPWFRVRRCQGIKKGKSSSKVIVGKDTEQFQCYCIEGNRDKVSCRILDKEGGLVAEVRKKESTTGITFGDDVMRLVVESNVDHSLIMSFVIVHTLSNHRM